MSRLGNPLATARRTYPTDGIDFPEKSHAYGKKSKHAASELVFGKEVMLQTHDEDTKGRTLADALLTDGTNLNQELVTGAQGILLAVQSTVLETNSVLLSSIGLTGRRMLVPVDRHLVATPKEGQHEVRTL
jgi:hypothetical protein